MKLLVELPDDIEDDDLTREDLISMVRYAVSNMTHPNDGSPVYFAPTVTEYQP